MKYKIIPFLFLLSCVNMNSSKNNFSYSAKGFAKIENNYSLQTGSDFFYVSHNKLKQGTKIRISNPNNEKFVEAIVGEKIKYDNFYKVLISIKILKELNLDIDFPYVEINEIKSNKSFIAKKAITDIAEKKIANKAPVASINIDNLSKVIKVKKIRSKDYSILVAEFYNLESAEFLKIRLESILQNSNYQLIYINKNNNKSYDLLLGPYNTINKLKNDYIILNDSDFEDLDIKIND